MIEYNGFTPSKLIEFENDIAAEFNAAKIKAPVHLYNGNEKEIIEIFKKHQIGKDDWVLNSWRSHYQCFLGDMTSETGSAHECIKYSRSHQLPIHFIIEDNGKSVCTITRDTWKLDKLTYENVNDEYVTYYSYKLDKYPHAGAGTREQF